MLSILCLRKEFICFFIIKYTHSAESCFKNNKETSEIFKNRLRKANEYGVTIKFNVGNSLEHAIFMLIETDTAEGVHEWLDPIVDLGHIELTSVIEKKL